ncbi:hypothetical protein [Croceibacterium aestuarii]|uniref:hypothetical protein n=1 Tax=Croceibacterium aestuarii TaxID=3064139 RepID=UPI00272EC146|nr:hypothetical protein [Croceibacterium sp. D39]
MMTKYSIGALLASLALATSAGAQTVAVTPCVSESEVSAMVRYAMPQAIAASRVRCSQSLASNGFFATRGDKLASRYAVEKDATWPGAKSALLKIAGGSKDKDIAALADLPDEAIRPLVDALIQQKLAESIKPGSCSSIERVAEAISPLDPSELGDLAGVIAVLALKDEKPLACPAGKK